MQANWAREAIFYHIYPLGFCGAPERNDFCAAGVPRLDKIRGWIGHLRDLGVTALYLGPVFESTAHGYDTADYFWVDRRLGTNETLRQLIRVLHQNGIRVVLDGVFNHVGRDFWAFRDVLQNREHSPYRNWFKGLNFGGHSPYGDALTYETWNGCYDLVKLNLDEPAVREHLLLAVRQWVVDFEIDGFRLDVADCLDLGFQRELAAFCRSLKPDFWLMGEVVHGDYNRWATPEILDSVTNYEVYKGLYSSLADKNYFEIAYALQRQFGADGLYRDLPLYNFVDNHDVNRVASQLKNPAHLYPLYCLLFTMPGVPSIYYGSEWGLTGKRTPTDDRPLRPDLDLDHLCQDAPQPGLAQAIRRLADLRRGSVALKRGDYAQLFVSHEQLAFARTTETEQVLVLLNAAAEPSAFELPAVFGAETWVVDLLNSGESFGAAEGRLRVAPVPPHWARILRVQRH
jgi:glycosidase